MFSDISNIRHELMVFLAFISIACNGFCQKRKKRCNSKNNQDIEIARIEGTVEKYAKF